MVLELESIELPLFAGLVGFAASVAIYQLMIGPRRRRQAIVRRLQASGFQPSPLMESMTGALADLITATEPDPSGEHLSEKVGPMTHRYSVRQSLSVSFHEAFQGPRYEAITGVLKITTGSKGWAGPFYANRRSSVLEDLLFLTGDSHGVVRKAVSLYNPRAELMRGVRVAFAARGGESSIANALAGLADTGASDAVAGPLRQWMDTNRRMLLRIRGRVCYDRERWVLAVSMRAALKDLDHVLVLADEFDTLIRRSGGPTRIPNRVS